MMTHRELLSSVEELAYEDLIVISPGIPHLSFSRMNRVCAQHYGVSDGCKFVSWLSVETLNFRIICAGLHYWEARIQTWMPVPPRGLESIPS